MTSQSPTDTDKPQAAKIREELEQGKVSLAEVARQLEEYQTIFASMPIMLWYKDTDNRHIRVNKAAAALEGIEPEAIEGKSAYDMYPFEQAAAYHADDLQVINSGKPKLGIIEKHTSPVTGELMWLQTGKVPMRNKDGEIIGVIAFAVDITEQKRAEEALQEQKQRLTRANEFFRTTLEYLEDAVQRGTPTSELVDYVKYARTEFERLE